MANLNKTTTAMSTVFAGSGSFFLADVDAQGKRTSDYTPMGIVDSANLTIEATNIEKFDSSQGLAELFSRITIQQSGTITFTVSEISFSKIAQFLFGDYSKLVEEVVSSEEHTVLTLDSYLMVGKIFKEGVAIVVKDETGTTTYEENKNYEVDASGIHILSDEEQTARGAAVNIAVSDVLTLDYTAVEMEKIDGFTKSSNKKAVYFQGISLDDGKEWIFEGYKLSFDPMSELPFVAVDDFATYSLTATLEKVSGNASSFFELKKAA